MTDIPAIIGIMKRRISEKFWSSITMAHFPHGIGVPEVCVTGSTLLSEIVNPVLDIGVAEIYHTTKKLRIIQLLMKKYFEKCI